MQFVKQIDDILNILVIYLYNNYYYPSGTLPIPSESLLVFIIALLGVLPASLPLVYYASKLQLFVRYSEMWVPWKKLFWGWVLIIIGGIIGASALGVIYLFEIIPQNYAPITLFILLLSPLLIFTLISIILTFIGIRKFYQNAKTAVGEKDSVK